MSFLEKLKSRFSLLPSGPDERAEAEPPFLISWNITERCNLKCAHCYLDASELEGRGETTTAEAKRFIDEIASLSPHAMLILTGGEPLMRPDCMELSMYASGHGLTVVLGTNGTLLDDRTVNELKKNGVRGFGISLDSVTPDFHNRFRGVEGAWEKTVKGIENLKKHGLDFQLQLTVTMENRAQIPELIEFGAKSGAMAVNIFFLVCTGRGQNMTDLGPEEYEKTLEYLVNAEKAYEGRLMVRARCAPHFLRVAESLNPASPTLKGETSGCIAGRGYLRISPEGYVTPCPYMPADDGALNLKNTGLKEIWHNDRTFKSLRSPEYSGRCKDCEFNDICGGCRARSLVSSGDLMGEDPWCEYESMGKRPSLTEIKPAWTDEAEKRLTQVPPFLRSMVKKGVERYAVSKELKEIPPDLMGEMRKRAGR